MEAIELTIITNKKKRFRRIECTDIDALVLKYLEKLDNDGVIEDYANSHAKQQFTHSYHYFGKGYHIEANDIIKLVDKYFDGKTNDDLNNAICDLKKDYHEKLERLRSYCGTDYVFFVPFDESIDYRIYIGEASKYFDYFYDVVYEYYKYMIENSFKEASKVYPFIGEF